MMKFPASSLYIHIPFCASKCYYCDFNSYVSTEDVMERYVRALDLELAKLSEEEHTVPLKTVFFGGGTPSLLPPRLLERVFHSLHTHFRLEEDAEVSLEANPGTVTADKLQVIKEGGVNRLSFGVQTLNEPLLKKLGRLHDKAQVYQSYRLARQAGFSSINLDVMFNLPHQTADMLTDTLGELKQLGPEHISAYALKVEEGTPFGTWLERGQLELPPEETDAEMYKLVQEFLQTSGYAMYEISNFAKPGHSCRHNLVYWRNEPYLAAGAGAHGYVNGVRYQIERSVPAYMVSALTGARPLVETEAISESEQAEDTMILGLRLLEGISDQRFRSKHGFSMFERFQSQIQKAVDRGLIQVENDCVKITQEALPIANELFLLFLE